MDLDWTEITAREKKQWIVKEEQNKKTEKEDETFKTQWLNNTPQAFQWFQF